MNYFKSTKQVNKKSFLVPFKKHCQSFHNLHIHFIVVIHKIPTNHTKIIAFINGIQLYKSKHLSWV